MKQFLTIVFAFLFAINVTAQYSNTTIQVGQKAPELAFTNPKGEELKLSEINKNKIVLIDFWASWCGPCRASSPALVKLYNEYTNKKFKGAKKGFTVLSFSLDKDMEAWKKAITTDKLDWPNHMSDLKFWQSEGGKAYGIAYIPQCFLVDGSGMIIGKYNKVEEAEKDLIKLLK